MKTRLHDISLLSSFIFIVGLILAIQTHTIHAGEIHFTTEEYPPYNYTDDTDGEIKGFAVDVAKAIMKRAGLDFKIELLPWNRAYFFATEKPNTCVFATAMTPERMPLFKWVGPFADNDWVLIGRSDSDQHITTLDDVRDKIIGGYHGDAASVYLEQLGFKVSNTSEDSLNAKMLELGRIDLWATSSFVGLYQAKVVGVKNLKIVYEYKKGESGIACNLETDDVLISKMNNSLQELRVSGELQEITAQYLSFIY